MLTALMKAGIIGLPGVGKTTIFNVLTHGKAATGPAGRKLEPNVGIVKVPDPRVDFLASKFDPDKTTYATVEFVDVQGLARGKGQDMALAPLRTVDVLIHVLRAFEDEASPHPEGSIDTERDRRNLEYEFMLADIASIEKRMERLEKDLKKLKNAAGEKELAYLVRAKAWLESERPLREMETAADEKKLVKGFAFLSEKPVIYVENIGEDQLERLKRSGAEPSFGPNTERVMVCGKLEAEMAELSAEELRSFLADYGLTESGAERLIRGTYTLLGLISFLTAGKEECRAWTIPRGATAQRAAGVIHTDLESHFIRAEVCSYADFVQHGSFQALKEKGLLRLEGKEYIVADGDILTIRHSG
ncbi:MAG TPA: redox-regulated ATPase YchF [Terriglobia bacterium]|nr:redox-regulated ATPase YchF [Terriglobia bacterium]